MQNGIIKKLLLILIIVLAAVLMAVTNPTKQEYVDWIKGEISS
jgi:hypothetical protein